MKFKNIQNLKDEEFRRLTGIKRKTFNLMVEIINKHEERKLKIGGRPNKLTIEDRILMTLEYLREYRTFFHIAKTYGISETRAHENIRQTEDILIKSKKFSLPKRKEILYPENDIEVYIVDATETPIERPKKNK